MAGSIAGLTGVADTSVMNLNADLMGLGGSNLDILDGERLAGSPGNGSLKSKTVRLDLIHRE
jgi:hypothetical protein